MSELGQHLKEVREQKQISLDDLQQTTKIQKRYLLAIEEGRFDALPGLFYARAFVKTYAEAIGLDPDPLFEQYEGELPNPSREAVVLPSRSDRTRKDAPERKTKGSSVLPVIIAIGIIFLIAVAVWFIAQSQGWGEKGSEPVTPNEQEYVEEVEFSEEVTEDELTDTPEEEMNEETEPVEEEQAPDESESEATLTFTQSVGNTSYYELTNGQLDDVRIEVTGKSYIDVKNATGEIVYSGEPKVGEGVVLDQLADEKEVIFNFGASQHVQLFISGEKIEYPLDKIHQKIAITVIER